MLRNEPRDVTIPMTEGELCASLVEPGTTHTLVIFAHGSGSSRFSPRNLQVADHLGSLGFGTLLLDLLTEEEDEVYQNRFDIPLLSNRLVAALHWAKARSATSPTRMAFFGASTGAAAALIAAASLGTEVKAVISRGGRPDLAGDALGRVHCPTLLIVGELDDAVIALNEQALRMMPASTVKELRIIPKATHLFPEPGALERVADLAGEWLLSHAVEA